MRCPCRVITVAAAITLAAAVIADVPPYKRLLEGEDREMVEALEKQIAELGATTRFAEAVTPAKEILAIRSRVQGADHWEAVDARWKVKTLRQVSKKGAERKCDFLVGEWGAVASASGEGWIVSGARPDASGRERVWCESEERCVGLQAMEIDVVCERI